MMPRLILSASALFAIVALSGCTPVLKAPTQNAPKKDFSTQNHYVSASNSPKGQPQTLTQYVPVPIPGQLMPVPKDKADAKQEKASPPVFYSKEKAVQYANKQAAVTPQSQDFFNSMMSYNFMPGALYTIYTAPLHITDIMLAPGEKMISEAAGDTTRWQIAQTYSGQGASLRQHLLIKPNQAGLSNSMVITTNQRVYHLILKSEPDVYMVSVQWNYPQDMVQISHPMPSAEASSSPSSPYSLNLGDLDFGYKIGTIKGDQPAWYPTRVFNDGRQTFIEFPKSFYNDNTPILYVSDDSGAYSTMVNWRIKGRYMIIDQVVKKARLETGTEKTGQTIVQIQHD